MKSLCTKYQVLGSDKEGLNQYIAIVWKQDYIHDTFFYSKFVENLDNLHVSQHPGFITMIVEPLFAATESQWSYFCLVYRK